MWLAYGKAKCFLIYQAFLYNADIVGEVAGEKRAREKTCSMLNIYYSILYPEIRLGQISKGKLSRACIKCRFENVNAPNSYRFTVVAEAL